MLKFPATVAVALLAISGASGVVLPRFTTISPPEPDRPTPVCSVPPPAASTPASPAPPKGWNTALLEPYNVYHTRYLALGCQTKHTSPAGFFDQCCHPLLKNEKLSSRPAKCTPTVPNPTCPPPIVAQTPPKGWNTALLEPYDAYHTRYLALGCQTKHASPSGFFDQCCHPLLKNEKLSSRPAKCTPSGQITSITVPIITTVTISDGLPFPGASSAAQFTTTSASISIPAITTVTTSDGLPFPGASSVTTSSPSAVQTTTY